MIVTVTLNAALDRTLTVPNFARGQPLGELRVYQGRRLVGRSVLVAERSVSRPGALGRIGFYASGTAKHMWGWVH